MNIPSDFPRHHRSTSPDRAEVLMVVLVTIASVVVCGWIAVWLLSDVGAAWLGAVAGLPVAMPRRFAGKQRQESPPGFDVHVAALRDAGFREVGTIWQVLSNRVLLAVR